MNDSFMNTSPDILRDAKCILEESKEEHNIEFNDETKKNVPKGSSFMKPEVLIEDELNLLDKENSKQGIFDTSNKGLDEKDSNTSKIMIYQLNHGKDIKKECFNTEDMANMPEKKAILEPKKRDENSSSVLDNMEESGLLKNKNDVLDQGRQNLIGYLNRSDETIRQIDADQSKLIIDLLKSAETLVEQKQFKEALEQYDQVVKRDSRCYKAIFCLGMICLHLKKYVEASEKFKEVLEINWDYIEAREFYGHALRLQEDFKTSRAIFLKLTPKADSSFISDSFSDLFQIDDDRQNSTKEEQKELLFHPDEELDDFQIMAEDTQSDDPSEIKSDDFWISLYDLDPLDMNLSLGWKFICQYQWKKAIRCFEKAIKVAPKCSKAYDDLGHAQNILNEFEKATKNCKMAILYNEKNASAYHNLGVALYGLGRTSEAIESLKQGIIIDPQQSSSYVKWGQILFDNQMFREAQKRFKEAIKINPKYGLAHFKLGEVHFYQEKYKKAIKQYKIVEKINPNYLNFYPNWARALEAKKRYAKAFEKYAIASKTDLRDSEACLRLSDTLSQKKHYKTANQGYKKSIKLNPMSSIAYIKWGNVLLRQWDYGKVRDKYKKASKLNPTSVRAHLKLGELLRNEGRYDEALSEYEEALKINSNLSKVCLKCCDILSTQGMNDKAGEIKKKYELAMKNNKRCITLYNIWNNIFSIEKEFDKIFEDYKTETQNNPNSDEAYYKLQDVLYIQKSFYLEIERYRNESQIYYNYSSASSRWLKSFQKRFEQELAKYEQARVNEDYYETLVKSGDVLYLQKQYEKAIKKYAEATQIKPCCLINIKWADILTIQNKYDEAIEKYKEASQIKSDCIVPYCTLYSKWADALVKKKEYNEAIDKYNKAIKFDSGWSHTYAYVGLGNVLHIQGKLDEAIEKYEKATEIDSNCSQAYVDWGKILSIQGRYVKAIEIYKKAIETDPDCLEAYFRWGEILVLQEIYKEAIEVYRKCGSLEDEINTYIRWGDKIFDQEPDVRALYKYEMAIKLNPRSIEANIKLGNALFMIAQYDEAVIKYKRAIYIDPNCFEAHFNLGQILLAQKKYQRALSAFKNVSHLYPNLIQTYINQTYITWGNELSIQKQYKEAADIYSEALETEPNCENIRFEENKIEKSLSQKRQEQKYQINSSLIQVYMNWGDMLASQNDYNEAIEKYKKVNQSRPQIKVHIRLADCLFHLKRYPEAKAKYRLIARITPKKIYVNLGASYAAGKQYAEAEKVFTEALARNPNDSTAYLYWGTCSRLKVKQVLQKKNIINILILSLLMIAEDQRLFIAIDLN